MFKAKAVCALAAVALAVAPAAAQLRSVDPDMPPAAGAIDGDLGAPVPPPAELPATADQSGQSPGVGAPVAAGEVPPVGEPTALPGTGQTYRKDDLIGAAEGAFGKGAKGLAGLIEDLLRKQGEPNGYIVGREGGGAFVVGVRYGSGTLYHKVEGQKPVYWTGPSIGFDAGANAGSTFVLVYNLNDTADLYQRYAAGEGQAYFIGGFHVSYLRRGNKVLIPVRTGAGLRLGINAGYMRFTEKQRWVPF